MWTFTIRLLFDQMHTHRTNSVATRTWMKPKFEFVERLNTDGTIQHVLSHEFARRSSEGKDLGFTRLGRLCFRDLSSRSTPRAGLSNIARTLLRLLICTFVYNNALFTRSSPGSATSSSFFLVVDSLRIWCSYGHLCHVTLTEKFGREYFWEKANFACIVD